MKSMREKIGDAAEWLCDRTGERFWRLLHPIIGWGWAHSDDNS